MLLQHLPLVTVWNRDSKNNNKRNTKFLLYNIRTRTISDRIKSKQKQVNSVKIRLSKQTGISTSYDSNYYYHALNHNLILIYEKKEKENYLYQ